MFTLSEFGAYAQWTQSMHITWIFGYGEHIPYFLESESLPNINSRPPHNLKIWSLSTFPLNLTLSEPKAHWFPKNLVLVNGNLSPSEPSTKSGPLQLRFFPLKLQQTTHSTTQAYIHPSMKIKNLVSISYNHILSQSIAHTKMCREFDLHSNSHS